MKRLFIPIMMAALLSACGHRASTASDSETDTLQTDSVVPVETPAEQLLTDSIGVERSDSAVTVFISADWPTEGPEALVAAVRRFIMDELEVKGVTDGRAVMRRAVNKQFNEMYDTWNEVHEDGEGGIGYQFTKSIEKAYETDRYVTYLVQTEGYEGGAHGWYLSVGTTFRKPDGKIFGYESVYDEQKEKFYMRRQTLFSDTKSPRLHALLKEGVRNYMSAQNQGASVSDEEEAEMLMGVDDVNRLPLPQHSPYFTKDGLAFVYQQYEIASYADGLPSFTVDYDQIRPFLTDEAAALIADK